MGRWSRYLLLAALSTLLLAACSSDSRVIVLGDSPPTGDRIAYIGNDNNVYTINGDGTDRQRLTQLDFGPVVRRTSLGFPQVRTSFYAWPTWSPDGQKIAVSRVVTEGTPADGIELRSIDLASDVTNGRETVVFTNTPGAGQVARGAPHYIYWHPDCERVTFLAAKPGGLTLYLGPVDGSDDVEEVISGGPLYFTWSPDGGSALFHVGQELLLAQSADAGKRKLLPPEDLTYRAASWSYDSARMAFIDDSVFGGHTLFAADADGENPEVIAGVGTRTAFMWSPTNDLIAFSDTTYNTVPYHSTLTVVDTATHEVKVAINEPILAFFWSPDGSRIAYVSIDRAAQRFSWKVLAMDGTLPRVLTDFIPSNDLFTMLSFFDQYSYSNSLWSPDGTQLVFSGQVPRPDGSVALGDEVFVIDVDDDQPPVAIADGSLAFWSWN